MTMTAEEREAWLAIRKEAGLRIDPETAEVDWEYGQVSDPYELESNIPDEFYQIGRIYFARAPGSDIWVEFGDLPSGTRRELWRKHSWKLAFPAGLRRTTPLTQKERDEIRARLRLTQKDADEIAARLGLPDEVRAYLARLFDGQPDEGCS
jgi:hypothetical protein